VNKYEINISKIRVTQLFINRRKYVDINKWLTDKSKLEIPVLKLGDEVFCIDGHSRLFTAMKKSKRTCTIYEDIESLSLVDLYLKFIKWCEKENVCYISDLEDRILSEKDYKKYWIKPCELICRQYEEES